MIELERKKRISRRTRSLGRRRRKRIEWRKSATRKNGLFQMMICDDSTGPAINQSRPEPNSPV